MERRQLEPEHVDAVVFDVIGTLVDEDRAWAEVATRLAVETGVADGADLRERWVALLDGSMDAVVRGEVPWRSHQLLVTEAAREAVVAAGGRWTDAAPALVDQLDGDYPAWPEVADATAALRRRRLVAGVSNGDLDALARLAHRNAISWDVVLSTGAAGTFKPDPAAYRWAIETLRLDPARTLFAAAHPWDLRAAAEHGFRTAYVARPGAERPAEDDRFDLSVADVSDLARVLE